MNYNPVGTDARAIMAFGKSAQQDATNSAMEAFGPVVDRPPKPDEGADGVPGRLETVYNSLVRRANASAQRMLRAGTDMYRGGASIGEAARSAMPSRVGTDVRMGREPVYARDGGSGGNDQPYIDVGGYATFLGDIDANDPAAVSSARKTAQARHDWIMENGGYAKTDFDK